MYSVENILVPVGGLGTQRDSVRNLVLVFVQLVIFARKKLSIRNHVGITRTHPQLHLLAFHVIHHWREGQDVRHLGNAAVIEFDFFTRLLDIY